MLVECSARTRRRVAAAALCCAAPALTRPAAAQLPGLPAAQSAFGAPGLALALNAGHGDGRTVAGLAAATGVRRLQLTAAVGLPGAPAGYDRQGVSAGARLAARLYRTPRLGVSAFAGYGAEFMRAQVLPAVNPLASGNTVPAAQPLGHLTQIPVGISAGLRGLLGERPYALSLAPMYAYTRWHIADSTRTRGGVRLAALAELAFTRRIGAGVAIEVGSSGPAGSPYEGRRTVYGIGVSYALHRVVAR